MAFSLRIEKVMYMRRIATLIIVLAASFSSRAQSPDIGLWIGGSQYYGDVGIINSFYMPEDLAFGVFIRWNFNDHLALRTGVGFGGVRAADSLSEVPFRVNRNLSFRSDIFEADARLELNFWPYIIGVPEKHSMYVFAGIGFFTFEPQALYQDTWWDLQPLNTEGQGTVLAPDLEEYRTWSLSVPFGIGYKANIGRRFAVSVEFGARRTFTDYIDDVSGRYVDPDQLDGINGAVAAALSDRSLNREAGEDNTYFMRGNRETNDWYFISAISLSFKIFDKPERCHDFDD